MHFLSAFDPFVAITFGKSRRDGNMIKSFYPIHVFGELTGTQPARPEEVSNGHSTRLGML